jgi:hypothetical protein
LERAFKGPVITAYQKITETGSTVAALAVNCYHRRHEFGLVGIAATTVTAGGRDDL